MTVYFDTSNLLKLYIAESGSEAVRATAAGANVVAAASITYAEVRAALARLRNLKELTAREHAEQKRRFDQDWPTFLTIEITDSLAKAAGDLAERHALHGCDAVQLAAFVQLLQSSEDEDVESSSADDRLNKAARSLG